MASGLSNLPASARVEQDGVPDEVKVSKQAELRADPVQQGEQFVREARELLSRVRPVLVSPAGFSERWGQLPAEVQAFLERRWPGFASGVSTNVPAPVCPAEDLVEDEGLQSSDEDDIPFDEEDGVPDEELEEEEDDDPCSSGSLRK